VYSPALWAGEYTQFPTIVCRSNNQWFLYCPRFKTLRTIFPLTPL